MYKWTFFRKWDIPSYFHASVADIYTGQNILRKLIIVEKIILCTPTLHNRYDEAPKNFRNIYSKSNPQKTTAIKCIH